MARLFLFILLMAVVIIIWYFSIPFVINLYGEPTNISAAGDMFGGINALFSGLALAGVIFAVWLQILDVRTNQNNLDKTIESNKHSLEIMALSALIQECNSALERYERWEQPQESGDYSSAKKKVRDKLKEHRENLEKKLSEIEST